MSESSKPASYRWDLCNFPNYNRALEIEEVSADALEPVGFYKNYVLKNRPCLVKGAVSTWKATRDWKDIDYLKKLCANTTIRPRNIPKIETFGVSSCERDRLVIENSNQEETLPSIPFEDFLTSIASKNSKTLYAETTQDNKEFQHFEQDFSDFPFVDTQKKSLFYPNWGVMLYQNSYSDWHFHKFTEALMCQIKGDKETLLLAPDRKTWSQFSPVFRDELKYYNIPQGKHPSYDELTPYRVAVKEGDALFIPANWWHAVQSLDNEFGITSPHWWPSPLKIAADLRSPANATVLKHVALKALPTIINRFKK